MDFKARATEILTKHLEDWELDPIRMVVVMIMNYRML